MMPKPAPAESVPRASRRTVWLLAGAILVLMGLVARLVWLIASDFWVWVIACSQP